MFFLLLKKIFINTGTGGFHGERSRRFVSGIFRLIFNETVRVNFVSSGCMKGSREDKNCRILLPEKGLTFFVSAGPFRADSFSGRNDSGQGEMLF